MFKFDNFCDALPPGPLCCLCPHPHMPNDMTALSQYILRFFAPADWEVVFMGGILAGGMEGDNQSVIDGYLTGQPSSQFLAEIQDLSRWHPGIADFLADGPFTL